MSNAPVPPRFVPTLTEVVPSAALPGLTPEASKPSSTTSSSTSTTPTSSSPSMSSTPYNLLEEQIVNRVMQRVDIVLERRLREAVGQLILTHTQALGLRLQEEIESVVQESVSQAMAQELASRG